MKKLFLCFLISILFLCLTSCFNVYNESIKTVYKPFEEGTEVEENENINEDEGEFSDKLFIKEGEKITLYTNNLKYWSVRGYTLWKFFNKEIVDNLAPKIKVRKLQGEAGAGYGLICFRNKQNNEDRFLCILVYMDGKYSVGYAVNGKYETIVWKRECEKLQKGIGVTNTIRVKKNGKAIEIYFSDEEGVPSDYIIENPDKYKLGEGEAGVIGIISPKDNFPDTFVHIEYEK